MVTIAESASSGKTYRAGREYTWQRIEGSMIAMTYSAFGYSTGDRIGLWTIQGSLFNRGNGDKGGVRLAAVVQCDCGTIAVVDLDELRRKRTNGCRSCQSTTRTHGMAKTRLWTIWMGMKHRCLNSNCKHYHRYGGRGVTVCREWADDFVAFRDWSVANGYDSHLQIDRINNDGNYEPSNCRWATVIVNSNNKSTNRAISAFGETKTIADWFRDSRCKARSIGTLHSRLSRGYGAEEAISTPRFPTGVKSGTVRRTKGRK
jgi:hypothetical protein